jgi:hypothetical protein
MICQLRDLAIAKLLMLPLTPLEKVTLARAHKAAMSQRGAERNGEAAGDTPTR